MFAAVFDVRDEPHAAARLLRLAAEEREYQSSTQLTMIAWWLAHYGDAVAALAVLSRAYGKSDDAVASWLWLPALEPVRRSPEFKNILRQIGLVDYWQSKGTAITWC